MSSCQRLRRESSGTESAQTDLRQQRCKMCPPERAPCTSNVRPRVMVWLYAHLHARAAVLQRPPSRARTPPTQTKNTSSASLKAAGIATQTLHSPCGYTEQNSWGWARGAMAPREPGQPGCTAAAGAARTRARIPPLGIRIAWPAVAVTQQATQPEARLQAAQSNTAPKAHVRLAAAAEPGPTPSRRTAQHSAQGHGPCTNPCPHPATSRHPALPCRSLSSRAPHTPCASGPCARRASYSSVAHTTVMSSGLPPL